MAGHTRGPWSVVEEDRHDAHRVRIRSEGQNGGIFVAVAQGPDCQKNAPLIAAAPDMWRALPDITDLQAIQEALETVEDARNSSDGKPTLAQIDALTDTLRAGLSFVHIRAAIAKASPSPLTRGVGERVGG